VAEVLRAGITVVLGFVVFVLGQVAQRFFIEPIQEQRRVIGEITLAVLYYDNVGEKAKAELREETAQTLRKLSGQLLATRWTVPQYRRLEPLGLVEKKDNVIAASDRLLGCSNTCGATSLSNALSIHGLHTVCK